MRAIRARYNPYVQVSAELSCVITLLVFESAEDSFPASSAAAAAGRQFLYGMLLSCMQQLLWYKPCLPSAEQQET
jgi:hypothetical protein